MIKTTLPDGSASKQEKIMMFSVVHQTHFIMYCGVLFLSYVFYQKLLVCVRCDGCAVQFRNGGFISSSLECVDFFSVEL